MHADARKLLWDARRAVGRVAHFTRDKTFAEYEADDFGYAPFDQRGGLGKVHQLFGPKLPKAIEALNKELAA